MDAKHAGVLLVGLIVGALVGWFAKPAPPPPAPEAKPAVAKPAPRPPEPPPEPTPKPPKSQRGPELEQCQATLQRIQDSYATAVQDKKNNDEIINLLEELVQKSGADSPEGRPMEWPDDVPEKYSPEGFAKGLEKLKELCPDQFPSNAVADCSEFPCAIHQAVDESGGSWDSKKCEAFEEVFGSGTSTWGTGGDDDMHIMHVVPVPEGQEMRDYMKEYEGNLRKRARHRLDAYQRDVIQESNAEPCADGDAEACMKMARAYRDQPEEAGFLRQGCEAGEGSACNNLAWQACHDRGECGQEALDNARRATELKPEDGKGAWDTYAYVLCAQGAVADANAAYQRSCDAGYQANCGKVCTR